MALESVGRVAYALGLILGHLYRSGERSVVVPSSLIIVMAGVQVGAHACDFYGKCVAQGEDSYWKGISKIVGIAGFVASGLWMVPLARHSEYSASVVAVYCLYLGLSLAHSVRPVHLNARGLGSLVLLLTSGVLVVQLMTLSLNIGWSLHSVFLCAPAHLMLQASLVVREMTTAEKEFDVMSTAGLLSRHDAFRFVFVLHTLAYFLSLIDGMTLSLWRVLPVVLLPWSFSLLSDLRNSHLSGLPKSFYRLFVTFTVTSGLGLFLEFHSFA